jgi:photosystem II stability/assembly factor-like uncharacterized protein
MNCILKSALITALNLVVIVVGAVAGSLPAGSAFTYQGQLQQSGSPANGTYDFQFSLWNALAGGSLVGATQTVSTVNVNDGLFSVALDFGASAFNGDPRWLQINVRTGAIAFTALSPRQFLAPTPYALLAGSAGAMAATNLTGTVPDARLSSNVVLLSTSPTFTGTVSAVAFQGNGAGLSNIYATLRWQEVTGTTQQAAPNTGYLANNATQVVITLPSAPAKGDVVRVTGVGAGGWKIAQNNGQFILSKNLSGFGSLWVPRQLTTRPGYAAASADGTKLVVLADHIYTSANGGLAWTAQNSTVSWNSIAASADGQKLVAGETAGLLYTSTDGGATWTPRMTGTNRNWQAVASSADGTRLLAAEAGGYLYTSTNAGVNWTARLTDTNRTWWAVASSANGTNLVAVVGGYSLGQVYVSANAGVSWTARGPDVKPWSGLASSADGSKLVGVTWPGQIWTSADYGVTWTARESERNWSSVASSTDGSKLIAAVFSLGRIYTSTDYGVTWKEQESDRSWRSVASSADGGTLVAVENEGYIYVTVSATTTGTGGALVGDQGAAVELQHIGNGQFIPLSHEGALRVQ